MSDKTRLNVHRTEKITLREAIDQCRAFFIPHAVGLLYSPSHCYLARVKEDGSVETVDRKTGKVISPNLDSVFEARIFTRDVELRWLNHEGGIGPAVLVSEGGNELQGWQSGEQIENLQSEENQYLLWGKADGSGPAPGWSTVSENRIGPLHVPLEGVREHDHVILKTVEYFGEVDIYGNVAVVEERLCGLEVLKNG